MAFFYGTNLSWPLVLLVIILGLFFFYAIVSTLIFLINQAHKRNDELVKKIMVDSLASTAVVIILVHLVQMIARIEYFNQTGGDLHLVITSGMVIHSLGDIGPHLEAFGFDLGIFAIFTYIFKLRYR